MPESSDKQNLVSLRDHLLSLIEVQQRLHEQEIKAVYRAIAASKKLTAAQLSTMVEARNGIVESIRLLSERITRQFEDKDKALEVAFVSQEKAIQAALNANTIAIDKAESTVNERLAGMNEFRRSLSDQTSTFIPRSELESRFASIDENLKRLEAAQAVQAGALQQRIDTRGNSQWIIGVVISGVVGAAGLIIGVFSLLRH